MNIDFNDLNRRVNSILTTLPKEIDRSWLIAAFLSLKKAYELNYQRDDISRLSKTDQDRLLLNITKLDFSNVDNLTNDENIWIAGYFFNNAMFRMVALKEIGLQLLKRLMNYKRKGRPQASSKWYEQTFQHKLTNLENAQNRVDKMKHQPRQYKRNNIGFETMEEGLLAFNELLTLMEHISASNSPIQRMHNMPS